MYKVDDIVIYGNNGVCTVKAVGKVKVPGIDPSRSFYTLKTYYDDITIFAPVDTNVHMRPILSREKALSLIDGIPDVDAITAAGRESEGEYRKVLASGDVRDIFSLIKGVLGKEKQAAALGKKLCQTDQRYLKNALNAINDELSLSLGIPRERVWDFVSERIES